MRRFFEEHTVDVADDGFTRRVMRRLPDRERLSSRLWTVFCVVAAVVVFILKDGFDSLISCLRNAVVPLLERYDLLQYPLLTAYVTVLILSAGVCGLILKEQ